MKNIKYNDILPKEISKKELNEMRKQFPKIPNILEKELKEKNKKGE